MLDIFGRAAYAQRIDWMGKGDPETAIGIADVQERMETALVDFEKQATAFRTKNKVEDFRLTNKPLIFEVLEQWLDSSNLSRTKTINTYAFHIRRFIKFGGKEPIYAITKLDAKRYIQHLVNSGLAHSTLETAVAAMRGLLHFAEEGGYFEFNSFSGLRLKREKKASEAACTVLYNAIIQAV